MICSKGQTIKKDFQIIRFSDCQIIGLLDYWWSNFQIVGFEGEYIFD